MEDARSTREAGASGMRKESQSSSSSGKRSRASSRSGNYPGQGQIRAASRARQMVCFHCQQPGHMRRDCPQRQGPQGFRTTQSQSVVGQAQIQFIPPHPSKGQRNQFQSQGAIQATSVAQMG